MTVLQFAQLYLFDTHFHTLTCIQTFVLDLFITVYTAKISYNGFTTTCFDSHESSSGYVQNLLVLAVLLLTVLEVVGRYEVVAVLTLI
jgi:hypothetical protein